MMTVLLWRCPLCGTNDALRYHRRWFRPHVIACSACGALWQVERPEGEDFRLRVLAGSDAPVGLELPLSDWYDRMKAGLTFVPMPVDSLPLAAGEEVYLRCDRVPLIVKSGNPLLAGIAGRDAPLGPLAEELTPKYETAGIGCLYFSNRRLIWEGEGRGVDFWWPDVLSAFAFFTEIFGIMYGATTYRFRVPGQSVLMWLTYAGQYGRRLEAESGRKITTSHY